MELKKRGVHNESDEVNSTTIHHKLKYEAMKIVQIHLNKYLILRPELLLGRYKT